MTIYNLSSFPRKEIEKLTNFVTKGRKSPSLYLVSSPRWRDGGYFSPYTKDLGSYITIALNSEWLDDMKAYYFPGFDEYKSQMVYCWKESFIFLFAHEYYHYLEQKRHSKKAKNKKKFCYEEKNAEVYAARRLREYRRWAS